MNYYKKADELHPAGLQVMNAVVETACAHLGIDRGRFFWIVPCEKEEADLERENEIGGLYTAKDDTVYVRADFGLDEIPLFIGHELRHKWQMKKFGVPKRIDSVLFEVDAAAYGHALRKVAFGLPCSEWEFLAGNAAVDLPESNPYLEELAEIRRELREAHTAAMQSVEALKAVMCEQLQKEARMVT